ncbi:MAG: MFS transporter [Thermomicrobiales bacterium]
MTTRPIVQKYAVARPGTADFAERRILVALIGAAFVGGLAFAAPPAFFPAIARDLDFSIALLGQMITGMLLLGAGFGLIAGPLADRHGYRRLLVLGALAAMASLLGVGLAPTYPVLLAAGLLGGVATATLPGLSMAVAGTAFHGAARPRAVGMATAGAAAAAVVGVPLLTVIGDATTWRAAFIVAALGAAGMAALLAAWTPSNAQRPATARRTVGFLAAFRPLLADRRMVRRYGALTLRSIVWFGLITYLGALITEEMGLSARVIGAASMLAGGGYVAGSLLASPVLGRLPARQAVVVSNLAMGAVALGVFSAELGAVGMLALLPCGGFASALGWVGMVTLLAAESPAGAGTTMALNGAIANLGAAGGGAAGGALLASGGFDALALGLPVVALAAALLVCRDAAVPNLAIRGRTADTHARPNT